MFRPHVRIARKPDADPTIKFVATVRNSLTYLLAPCPQGLSISSQMLEVHKEKSNVARSEIPITNQIIEIGRIAREKTRCVSTSSDTVVLLNSESTNVRDTGVIEEVERQWRIILDCSFRRLGHVLQVAAIVNQSILMSSLFG